MMLADIDEFPRSSIPKLFSFRIPLYSLLLFSHSVVSDSLHPHGLQPSFPVLHCVSWSLLKPCPLSQWCHPTISSSVAPLYSWPQSFPASGSFPVSWLCSGGQSIYWSFRFSINRSVNIQGWFPLGLTGLISLMSSGLLRVLSNTRVQKHQFFDAQLSL